jgi:lipopolysaccharide biosynthesis glycosyltransferase
LAPATAAAQADAANPILVLACDAAFAMPLATALRSVADASHDAWPMEIYILESGFCDRTRRDVERSLPAGAAVIRWMPVDMGAFAEFGTMDHISAMTYARLMIERFVPDSLQRILYLDADILVLRSIRELWRIDLQGATIGAVLDEDLETARHAPDPLFDGVPPVGRYFNAGMLLIDLARWRQERISEKAIAYLAAHPNSPYADQDALNAACDGRWEQLDAAWNFQSHERCNVIEMDGANRPAIIHFISAKKPWLARKLNQNSALYDVYRARTTFARSGRERLQDWIVARIFGAKFRLLQYPSIRAAYATIRPLLTNRTSW